MDTNTEQPTIKLSVKNLDLIFKKTYTLDSQDCNICRQPLSAPSAQLISSDFYKNKLKDILDDKPVIGECKHVYHKSCIDKLSVNNSCSCPTCNTPWKISKIIGEKTASYGIKQTN